MENKDSLPPWMTVHDGGLAGERRPPRRGGSDGGGGGDMTELTERVGALEETLRRLEPLIVRIDEQLRVILPTLATKAELQAFRTEARTDIKDTRIELKTEINDVRTDLTAEVQNLRTEWRARLPALASKADVQESKADLGARLAEKPGRSFIVTTVFAAIALCVAAIAATVAALQYIQPLS